MAEFEEPVVALHIFGDDLDPPEISSLLGVQPTTARRKGERRLSGDREILAKTGHWSLEGRAHVPGELNGRILDLLSELATEAAIWQHISDRFECRISIGIFMRETNEGAELRPETLRLLGSRGLALDFDLYGPLDD